MTRPKWSKEKERVAIRQAVADYMRSEGCSCRQGAAPQNATGRESDPSGQGRMNPVRLPQSGTTPAPVAPDWVAEIDALYEKATNGEWLCEKCNTVYPGPPQAGLMCVMCPKCRGTTLPRTIAERRQAEQRAEQAEAKLAAVTVERDKHYNRLGGLLFGGGLDNITGGQCREWAAEYINWKQRASEAEADLEKARAALKPFADEWMIGDESGELQHWPKEEVARCKAAYDALNPFEVQYISRNAR